jgi:hypothetical protein
MEITINCIPDGIKDKIADYSYGSLITGGEKTFGEFLDLTGFGKTKFLSFYHNNLQYRVGEYVYISPDAVNVISEYKTRADYERIFSGIMDSFKFTK